MSSLNENFAELCRRLKQGHDLCNTSDDPVFYLIVPPKDMLHVKRQFKAWSARLERDGWTVHSFSMAEAVKDICRNYALRDVWLEAEADAPLDFDSINETIKDALLSGESINLKLQQKLQELTGKKNTTVLFVTDVEALAPYLRVGSIEQRLQGKFTVPTVILYPGIKDGWTLSFLGIYPADGNYRANFIGG